MKKLLTKVAIAALVLAPLGSALAIGTNGSFELGTAPGVFTTVNTGGTDVTDWTVNSGSIDYIGSYWTASEGARSIDLNGLAAGTISQTFATAIGTKYFVTFDLSGNPDGLSVGDPLWSPSNKIVGVSATGAATVPFNYDTAVQANDKVNMKWAPQEYTFTATAANTQLTFASAIAGAFGPALDNVTIRACSTSATQATVVSDTSVQVDGHDAVAVTPHPAWTTIAGATWVHSQALDGNGSSPIGPKTFTKTFTITGVPADATLDIAADNYYSVTVNGHLVNTGTSATDLDNFSSADTWIIPAAYLVTGSNTMVVVVTNPGTNPDGGAPFGDPNPAGLLFKLTVNGNECAVPPPVVTECKAAPAIAVAYMKSKGVKPGSTLWKNVITDVAGKTGSKGIFWAAHSCDAGYADSVRAYIHAAPYNI